MLTIVFALSMVLLVLIGLLFGSLVALGCFVWHLKSATSAAQNAASQFLTAGVHAQVNTAASNAIMQQHQQHQSGEVDTESNRAKKSASSSEVKGFAQYSEEQL